ncbi:sigma-54-dependent Fis family transcriptional regulator [Thiohalorhabdus sp. Cl-TMA]|uniref:Sigma-54-dependent Fis family transcriptional regulator n=1 Tax=Thiohalorhabdus methylotrophus TaxID=3242694 RepID=A0ABV4TYD9_9GAMM
MHADTRHERVTVPGNRRVQINHSRGSAITAEVQEPSHNEWVWTAVHQPWSRPPSLTKEVLRSWTRCLDELGLDPGSRHETVYLADPELRARQERLQTLLEISKVEMNNLYQQVAASGYAIILSDAEGVVLHQVSDPELSRTVCSRGLRPGAVWSERFEGTNGIGTCLFEQKPIVIHRSEHFLTRNIELTCSAAPIFDSQGQLMAVLDISGCSTMAQQHSQVLVHMASQMIENRVFLNSFRDHYLIRFHSRPEFVSTLGEGILTFDEDGKCLAVNGSAHFQLGYESRADLVGRNIEEVLHLSSEELVDRALQGMLRTQPVHERQHGKRFFAVVQPPEGSVRIGGGGDPGRRPRDIQSKDSGPSEPGGEGTGLDFGDTRMARNLALLRKVADRDIPVLLNGETGTGKGVLAETFHKLSHRAEEPFVAVSCAAIPEELIESELFGYKPGAFTGASRHGQQGRILQANGGTLFLDEIGDMPLNLQVRLLRVLEEREVVPLGGDSPVTVDIQIVSATHQDLEELVAQGGFREDLYYRLKGVQVLVPPLREREDKDALFQHLVEEENTEDVPVTLDAELLEVLKNEPWPGNIRQARNTFRTMLALRESDRLTTADLPPEMLSRPKAVQQGAEVPDAGPRGALEMAERETLQRMLDENHWNVSATAEQLNLSRNTLYRKMKQYGIKRPK